jgi:hypothetical protein
MRIGLTRIALLLMLTCLPFGALAQVAPVPNTMIFQGRLARPDGTPVPDGNYALRLRLYDASTGGNVKSEQVFVSVPVRNGTFAVTLSDFAANTFNGNLWLGIKIGTEAELTPRQPFVSVAYAFKADSVKDGAITAASIANGTITTDKLVPNAFNSLAWLLGGNSGVTSGFLGTTDTTPLEFRVNNRRAMRYSYGEYEFGYSINVLGGSELNEIGAGVVGATIAGGGVDSNSGEDNPNRVTANFGAIVGGGGNTVSGGVAFIGGGVQNTASGSHAFIGGGNRNVAEGYASIIPGGQQNRAVGNFSFAAGVRAVADHTNTFVWASSGNSDFVSTGGNQFLIQASGGVGIGTNAPKGQLHVNGDYYGKGHLLLHAYEGDGSSGTAYVQARDTSGTSSVALRLRTQNAGSLVEAMHLTSGGNVGIGTTSPTYKLHVNGSVAGVGAYQSISDARYKTNIATFNNALDTILHLRGVTYDWKRADFPDMNFTVGKQIGFLAQEVEKILPELVMTDSNGYKTVAYANVVPVLVEAMKQQQKQISTQQKQLEALQSVQAENASLRARIQAIESVLTTLQPNRKETLSAHIPNSENRKP